MGQLGNVSQASQIFGYGRDTFYRFVCQHRIRVQLRNYLQTESRRCLPLSLKGDLGGFLSLPVGWWRFEIVSNYVWIHRTYEVSPAMPYLFLARRLACSQRSVADWTPSPSRR